MVEMVVVLVVLGSSTLVAQVLEEELEEAEAVGQLVLVALGEELVY